MAPRSSLLWEAGGPEGNNVDCAGFLCMPRRPYHWFVNKHGVHTFANEQLGLTERDESTHYPVFMHLWATNLPRGTRVVPRSDAAQTRRLLKATTKERAQAPTELGPHRFQRGGPCSKYCLSGKAADRLTHAPSLPIRCFPVTRRSVRLVRLVTPKVWPAWSIFWKP